MFYSVYLSSVLLDSKVIVLPPTRALKNFPVDSVSLSEGLGLFVLDAAANWRIADSVLQLFLVHYVYTQLCVVPTGDPRGIRFRKSHK